MPKTLPPAYCRFERRPDGEQVLAIYGDAWASTLKCYYPTRYPSCPTKRHRIVRFNYGEWRIVWLDCTDNRVSPIPIRADAIFA